MPPRLTWTNKAIALLGTDSDLAVAELIGCSSAAVHAERRRRHIPCRVGLGGAGPRRAAWPAADVAALGTASDRVIAEQLGRAEHAVYRERQLRGIKSHKARTSQGRPMKAWCNLTQAEHDSIQSHASVQGVPMSVLIRQALRSAGLLGPIDSPRARPPIAAGAPNAAK